LRASGLHATHCIPRVPSILRFPAQPEPTEPEARVDAICASIISLAELEPASVLYLTGPPGERGDEEARRTVVEAIAKIFSAFAAIIQHAIGPLQLTTGQPQTRPHRRAMPSA